MKPIWNVFMLAVLLKICCLASGKKMVCYFGTWAVYRPGNGKFDVENIDPNLCTHIIYGFTGLNTDNTIMGLDPYNDFYENYGRGALIRFTGLKKRNSALKALVAIGGWNEGSNKYSQMVSDPSKRATFINSVINFIQKYGFDGLDFDWEYPSCVAVDDADRVCRDSTDKQNYISLIRELKNAFARYGWMLTAAVSPGKSTIDAAYDIPSLANILDQVHVMTYDYHGTWEKYTGVNAPLYSNPNIESGANAILNANWTINYWLSNGVPASKIIMGMPLYGRGFTLDNQSQNGVYAPAGNPIAAGPYTRQPGTWGFNEICQALTTQTGWTVVRDPYYQVPYAYRGNQWIGYDDEQSLRAKGQYISAMDLGGALVWSIETDDFLGSCYGTPFILTKAIVLSMNNPAATTPIAGNSIPPAIPSTSTITTTTINGNPFTPSTTQSTTKVVTPSPSICQSQGYVSNPIDCGSFYQCANNGQGGFTAYSLKCAPGTVFSQSINSCTYPYMVPGCENYVG